jgi:DNA repair protein RadC
MNGLSTLHRINDAVRSEDAVAYLNPARPTLDGITTEAREDYAIRRALDILKRRLREPGGVITSPQASAKFLQLKLAEREREVFAVLFLDTRHRMICFEELFYGAIDGATVHPREIVKRGLQLNAAAVALAHNHPSGCAEPSHADVVITKKLKDALALIDVRVLDHIIVTADETVSLAQRGEL